MLSVSCRFLSNIIVKARFLLRNVLFLDCFDDLFSSVTGFSVSSSSTFQWIVYVRQSLSDKTMYITLKFIITLFSNSRTPQVLAWRAAQESTVGDCYKTVLTVNTLVG